MLTHFKQTTQTFLTVGVAQKNCFDKSCSTQWGPCSYSNSFNLEIDFQGHSEVRVFFLMKTSISNIKFEKSGKLYIINIIWKVKFRKAINNVFFRILL